MSQSQPLSIRIHEDARDFNERFQVLQIDYTINFTESNMNFFQANEEISKIFEFKHH